MSNTGTDPDWDMRSYIPRAIIINIATNDKFLDVNPALFNTTYVTFLKDKRTQYSSTEIFVMRTFGSYLEKETMEAAQEGITAGDKHLHYVNTTGWLVAGDYVDGVHPSDEGHRKVSARLKTEITPFLNAFTTIKAAPPKKSPTGKWKWFLGLVDLRGRIK